VKTHTLCAILITTLILSSAPLVLADQTTQQLRIIDGDTIVLNGERHRLKGIDSPETKQSCFTAKFQPWSCGQDATDALRKRIGSADVTCRSSNKDRYGRNLSVCFSGELNLNTWLVENGWAVAYRRYSKRYITHEQFARSDKAGIWAGRFIMPWQWRRGIRLSNPQKGESHVKKQ
jgi:endonuclease YncB( thermonuclease family)